MKLLLINSVCGIRSTGRIATDIALEYEKKGYEVKIAYGRLTVPEKYKKFAVRIGNNFNTNINALSCRIFDNDGFSAKAQTKKFLNWADSFNPDELWLHNLHGYYINIELLFQWIKSRPQMKVFWTLHDCWAFTGHCAHFTLTCCEKWKTECVNCPSKHDYPQAVLKDNSTSNYIRKRAAFQGVRNMELIVPSKWLSSLVKSSFLSTYPITVRYNTIDLSIFKPTHGDFRRRFKLEEKTILLGVASAWSDKKGLADFIKLSEILDDRHYTIVLVGLSKKQINNLPKKILAFEKTNNPKELAAIYTASDLFLNLTYEDNYPTVNLEAQACGTPVITYRTGGSPESVPAEHVVGPGDITGLIEKIEQLCTKK